MLVLCLISASLHLQLSEGASLTVTDGPQSIDDMTEEQQLQMALKVSKAYQESKEMHDDKKQPRPIDQTLGLKRDNERHISTRLSESGIRYPENPPPFMSIAQLGVVEALNNFLLDNANGKPRVLDNEVCSNAYCYRIMMVVLTAASFLLSILSFRVSWGDV